MQHCARCKIDIRGDKERCPLCGGALTGDAGSPAFPVIPRQKMPRLTVMKGALLVALVVEAAMLVLCFILKDCPGWAALIMIATLIGLGDVALTLFYRNNLLRLITWEIYIAMILVFLTDVFTGFHRWSVIWVLPVVFAALMITTTAVALATKMRVEEFILYLLFDVVMSSAVQLVFFLTRVNTLPLPAVISFVFVIVFFLAMLILNHRAFRGEARKFFNV